MKADHKNFMLAWDIVLQEQKRWLESRTMIVPGRQLPWDSFSRQTPVWTTPDLAKERIRIHIRHACSHVFNGANWNVYASELVDGSSRELVIAPRNIPAMHLLSLYQDLSLQHELAQ